MKIANVSFGAKIDKNTMNFLIRLREKGLKTKELEKAMKQVAPDGKIITKTDEKGDLRCMYLCQKNSMYQVVLSKFVYRPLDGHTVETSYKTNQNTINNITKLLKDEIGENNRTKVAVSKPIYKIDHEAELKKLFGEPIE